MKHPIKLAREFVAVVDGLKTIPGMMTTHDQGKESICRELLRLSDALQAIEDEMKRLFHIATEAMADPLSDNKIRCLVDVRAGMDALRNRLLMAIAAKLRGGA